MVECTLSISVSKSHLESLSNSDEAKAHIHGHGDNSNFDQHDLSMLQKITAKRIHDYTTKYMDMESLKSKMADTEKELGPRINLQKVIQGKSPSMALAAEFKRASPSKGDIAAHLSAGEQAVKYFNAGASVISVLTESHWFKGSLEDLTDVRAMTQKSAEESNTTRPAILCKDFVTCTHHILEAAIAGADTVLLIVAVTPADLLQELIQFCRSIDMEPLVEVHAEIELDVALVAGARVIGVNNRNLHTFQMDMNTTDRTSNALVQKGFAFHHGSNNNAVEYTLCSLSGMSNADDVDRYRQVGVGMCLIGESLMRSPDPAATIQSFCLNPRDYYNDANKTNICTTSGAYTGGTKMIKVCGITNAEDALVACRAGATLIGVIFVQKSKRNVSVEQAKDIVHAVRTFGERVGCTKIDNGCAAAAPLPGLVKKARAMEVASRRPLVVGVFQNKPTEEINAVVAEVGLDCVQLHGDEGFQACSECCVPAIRVVHMEADSDSNVDDILSSLTSDPVAVLLDTSVKGAQGGTGVTFDWNVAKQLQDRGLPVIVAGGLKVENVSDAVANICPWGIDVSSGVEASPGRKDDEKVISFVTNAKVAAQEASKGF